MFDVVIVGGGIIGGSIALELAQQKLRVLVLDRQQPGREASWAAAGMLSPAPESPSSIPLVPLARASLELYPKFVASVEELSGLRVGYRPSGAIEVFFLGDVQRELSTLVALHHGLGLPTEVLRPEEAWELEPALSREARAAALLPNEAAVDNRALTEAVVVAAARAGAQIRTGARVTSLRLENGRCTGVVASGKTILAAQVVISAGCYSAELEEVARYAPTRPVRGQMVAVESAKVCLRRIVRSERGYIVPRDDASPQKLVLGSTIEQVGFEKNVTPGGLERILSAALELAPPLADAAIVETWSGLRPGTPDHLPILGPTDIEGLVIATGHYRSGILLTPITAKLIREWLTERRTSISMEPFDPLRFLKARAQTSA